MCGTSVASILRDLPGFESVPQSFFPGRVKAGFARLPGVVTKRHEDGDPDNNSGVLMVQKDQS
jgi:hypothetical protein